MYEYHCRLVKEMQHSGVKMLVIACNTASAACLADARERYDVPVVEVIRPAVRRAVAVPRNGTPLPARPHHLELGVMLPPRADPG